MRFDEQLGTVGYAGPQGQFKGLDQINVLIPRFVNRGEVDVNVTINGVAANPVNVTIE